MDFISPFYKGVVSLKNMWDQYDGNKNEVARLQKFIQDFENRIPELLVAFKQHGVSGTSMNDLMNLRGVIMEATEKLNQWATDKKFFRVLTSKERMQELDRLEAEVMATLQKALGFITLDMVMQAKAVQKEILAEMKQIKDMVAELRSHRAQPVQQRTDQESFLDKPIATPKWINKLSDKSRRNRELSDAGYPPLTGYDGEVSQPNQNALNANLEVVTTHAESSLPYRWNFHGWKPPNQNASNANSAKVVLRVFFKE